MSVEERDLELERRIRAIPMSRAPRTLLPRVMAAIGVEAARPWWRRIWWAWPVPARAALVLALVVLAGLSLRIELSLVVAGLKSFFVMKMCVAWIWGLAPIFWHAAGQPLHGLVVVMFLFFAAFGVGFARLAAGGPGARHL